MMNFEKPHSQPIIRNANILTIDSHFSNTEALAIAVERILAVGTKRQVKAGSSQSKPRVSGVRWPKCYSRNVSSAAL